MKRLAVLKFSPVDDEAIKVYRERYERVLHNYGRRRFLAAVEWCIDNLEEYPQPKVFREAIPKLEATITDPLHGLSKEEIAEGRELYRKFIEESERLIARIGVKP